MTALIDFLACSLGIYGDRQAAAMPLMGSNTGKLWRCVHGSGQVVRSFYQVLTLDSTRFSCRTLISIRSPFNEFRIDINVFPSKVL